MTTLDQLNHSEDGHKSTTELVKSAIVKLANAVTEGREPNPGKELTWPETIKWTGNDPEILENEYSIRDLFVRKDLASQIIFPEKVEFTTKIADKAEKYFNDRKDSLDEIKYKKAMTALWIFINVQRKKAVKNGSLDLDATRKWLNWSPMNDEEDRFITEGFLKRLEEEEREIVSK